MYNNFAVNAEESRLDGQAALVEWSHDVTILPEVGLGRRLVNSGVDVSHRLSGEFNAAWNRVAGETPPVTYHHRDVPIFDGQRIWWGRDLTGHAFVRGSGDGLPRPAIGEYIIPLFIGRELTEVDDPQIERVTGFAFTLAINTEQREEVRMWLEMPTRWRPEGAADDSTSAEEAERPLQVGDIVRIRSGYPREQIPAEWQGVTSTFRARIETIDDAGDQARAFLIPLFDRPDNFGRSGFNWNLDAWERVEYGAEQVAEQVAEPTSGGKTAAEWEQRWNTFWEEGARRAQDQGYWRAFSELAAEFQVEANAPYRVEGRLRLMVSPRMAGSSGRVTSTLINSILYDAISRRNDRMREQGYEDMVLDPGAVWFGDMERVTE